MELRSVETDSFSILCDFICMQRFYSNQKIFRYVIKCVIRDVTIHRKYDSPRFEADSSFFASFGSVEVKERSRDK